MYINELLDLDDDKGGCLKIEFWNTVGIINSASVFGCFEGTELKKWEKCTIAGIAPEDATYVRIHLRMDCGGDIVWDDVTFTGATTKENYEVISAKRDNAAKQWEYSNKLLAEEQAKTAAIQLAPGAVNMIPNPGFEEAEASWNPFKGQWGPVISITDAEAHSGSYSAKILSTPATYNPWVSQTIRDNFDPNATYMLSAWVKAEHLEYGNAVFMKAELYSSGGVDNSAALEEEIESSNYKFNDAEWHRICMTFKIAPHITAFKFYLRTSTGNGVVYYDDVEFGVAGSSTVMQFYADATFNYTEVENIATTTTIDNFNHPIEAGSIVEYTIKDGDTVILQEAVPAAASIRWTFPTMTLAEHGKAYTISAAYKKADGTVITESEPRRIFRYNRPTMLDEQGRFIVDGKPLDPIMLYGAKSQHFADYAAAGITVIRIDDIRSDTVGNIDAFRKLMDEADKYGLKVLYQLYGNSAGHPFQIPTTKILVNAFKDHPALLAWMLCDEPSYQFLPGREAQTHKEIIEYVEDGYKVVRDIDPHHPTFVCEGTSGTPTAYEEGFRLADIVAIDPYPKANNETTWTYQITQRAMNALHTEKEVWNLGYAHDWYAPYFPTDDGLRMQNYMTIWAGADGYGYYTNDERTQAVIETLKKSHESGERAQMFDHFVRKNSPVFDEYMGNDFWHRSWVTKDGKMYLVVKEHANNGSNTEASFNLKSTNGLVEINGFTAKLVNGNTEQYVISDNSTFNLTLKPAQISMYQIYPNNAVDFSAVSLPIFNDLAGFEWAADAIENIAKNKIANSKGANIYAPGQNITRGDFAMYLIRSLGLTADAAEQFADVDPNAEYAKEVAIGKALGILKGTGGNVYNPEEPISRQDLMVICARGLRMVNKLYNADAAAILARFTDTGLIADYAFEDIGAMVSSKIVTGNPDMTINPLGNTTRAEAAVIMDRIIK